MDIGDIKYLEQPAKVLKLSEAIRIGSKIRPQGFICEREGRSCAMQAAREAITGECGSCGDVFKWAESHMNIPATVVAEVVSKNDYLKISREQIADWLESQGY